MLQPTCMSVSNPFYNAPFQLKKNMFHHMGLESKVSHLVFSAPDENKKIPALDINVLQERLRKFFLVIYTIREYLVPINLLTY